MWRINDTMKRKTIAEHAVDVLRETDNPAVCYGDSGLLGLIAKRAGMKSRHPLNMYKDVLDAMERRPDLFEKRFSRRRYWLVRTMHLIALTPNEPVSGPPLPIN
jgi:hypothetical protein